MSAILDGHEGVLCHMDDVIIFGKNQQEHDSRLHAALKTIQAAGVTLNKDKCEFSKQRLTFLGHVVDEHGISPDPVKTSAVSEMTRPQSVPELRRFLGMANQLGKFTPNLAELTQPLRELLSKKNAWTWGPTQEEAFKRVKLELTEPATLAIYNPEAETKISADASEYGIGAVLLQQSSTQWKPVAYASRALSETERRYSQIEKEALAITWACERFAEYIIGKHIKLETDHKPLVPLLSKKDLAHLPPRILRFRLRLTRFSYDISHVPGKLLYTADTLSRAPVCRAVEEREDVEMESFVQAIISSLPAGQDRLSEYRQAQLADGICSQVISYCKEGWPDKKKVSSEVTAYWAVRTELTIADNLLLYRNRIVVPKSLQTETLRKIHQGHQGIVKCRERVISAVWWPGVFTQLEEFVKTCPICLKTAVLPKEPLLQTPLPSRPWERIAADLCELKRPDYLWSLTTILVTLKCRN